jgi:hypothetical protein
MKNENLPTSSGFKVVCVWCGGFIRHNSIKDSRGMCLECYARLLNEHFRPQRAAAPLRSSER